MAKFLGFYAVSLVLMICSNDVRCIEDDLINSDKCLGGRCTLVLSSGASDQDIVSNIERIEYPPNSFAILSLQDAISGVFNLENKGFVINPYNSVLIWSRLEDLLEFLVKAEGIQSWKGEHYVKVENMSNITRLMEDQTVGLRFDAKIFFVSNASVVHEAYGITSKSTKTNIKIQEACANWPCDPMRNIWLRRSNLTGIHLIGGFVNNPPNAIIDPGRNSIGVSGLTPDLFEILKNSLNFTCDVVQARMHGRRFRNGSFSGIVGMMHRGEVDINFGSQILSFERMQVLDFAPSLMRTAIAIFYKASGAYELNMWQLLAVFEMDAWITYLIVISVSMMVLALFLRATNSYLGWLTTLSQSVAFVGRTALLRPYNISARLTYSTNMVCLIISFLCIVMLAYLRAGILSKLAVRTANLEVQSLEDIMRLGKKVMVLRGGYVLANFINSPPDSIMGQLWTHSIQPNSATTLDWGHIAAEGLRFVSENEDHVFVTLSHTGRDSELFPCRVKELGETLNTIDVGMVYQKDWPLKGLFDYYLNQMRSDGLVNKIKDSYYKSSDQNCAADTDPVLDFESMFGIFLILLVGVCLALLATSFEIVLKCRKSLSQKSYHDKSDIEHASVSREKQLFDEVNALRQKLYEQEEVIMKLKSAYVFDLEVE